MTKFFQKIHRQVSQLTGPIHRLLTGFLMLGLAQWVAGCGGIDRLVQTDLGYVQGATRNGVLEFRGIPYAAAPIGAKRFALPQAAAPWTGVLDASQFGKSCPQSARFNLTEASFEEDCLFVNVSSPANMAAGAKLPVFVWIHGGAFVGGGSNLYRLDQLANQGQMVVVSLNYRVGLFGFMPLPAAGSAALGANGNGNLGLEDQRLALKWVQKNIAAFGGDPSNVTVAGESAGAGSICVHLASADKVGGLFYKAVAISGGCLFPMPSVQEAIGSYVPYATTTSFPVIGSPAEATATPVESPAVGAPAWQIIAQNPNVNCIVPNTPVASLPSPQAIGDCLRNVKVKNLLLAQNYFSNVAIMAFSPTIGSDARSLADATTTAPRSFSDAIGSANFMQVPLIMGGAQNELRLYMAYNVLGQNGLNVKIPVSNDGGASVNSAYMNMFYGNGVSCPGSQCSAITKRYFPDPGTSAKPGTTPINGATFGSMISDFTPNVGINHCLYLKTSNTLYGKTGNKQYQFEFADPHALVAGVGITVPPNEPLGFDLGAVHSSVLNYFFPKLSNTAAINAPDLPATSQTLADQMVAYWSSFARTGVPAPTGLPVWPAYDGAALSTKVMRFQPSDIGPITPFNADAEHQCTGFWWAAVLTPAEK